MKTSDVRNRLRAVRDAAGLTSVCDQVGVGSGDCRSVRDVHRLAKRVTEIGILGTAAVASPPTRVDVEVHKIRESPGLRNARNLAGRQNRKRSEVDGICPFRSEVFVNELFVRGLIIRVVRDVLRRIVIKLFEGGYVEVTRSARYADSTEFVVLLP